MAGGRGSLVAAFMAAHAWRQQERLKQVGASVHSSNWRGGSGWLSMLRAAESSQRQQERLNPLSYHSTFNVAPILLVYSELQTTGNAKRMREQPLLRPGCLNLCWNAFCSALPAGVRGAEDHGQGQGHAGAAAAGARLSKPCCNVSYIACRSCRPRATQRACGSSSR